jgi:hypothetical protein
MKRRKAEAKPKARTAARMGQVQRVAGFAEEAR